MRHYTYLLIDLSCLIIPLLVSFYPKKPFYKEWRYFFPANAIVAVFFLIWDYWFTEMGVWGFNEDYLTGIYIGNLPVEEVLFFICIPYACTFTYFALKSLFGKLFPQSRWLTYILLFLSILMVLFSYPKLYTFYTAISLSIFLTYTLFKRIDLGTTYIAYLVILPFFFASNGLLTGSLLSAPIVWYDDLYNLGIRMGTIPVEDVFYGFLLVGMNEVLYERFAHRQRPPKSLSFNE